MTARFTASKVTFSPALGAPKHRAVAAAWAWSPQERSLPGGSPQAGPAGAEGRGRHGGHGCKYVIHGGQSRSVTQPVLSAGVSSRERARAHRLCHRLSSSPGTRGAAPPGGTRVGALARSRGMVRAG